MAWVKKLVELPAEEMSDDEKGAIMASIYKLRITPEVASVENTRVLSAFFKGFLPQPERPAIGRMGSVDDPMCKLLSQQVQPPVVPNLADLKRFLEAKPEGLSFPLDADIYEHVKSYDTHGMFTCGTASSYCKALSDHVYALFYPPSIGKGDTEYCYIPFWNATIHNSVEIFMTVTFIFSRSTNFETHTLALLPDYIGYVGDMYSVWRGEEKAPREAGDPCMELADKLVWVFRKLPYVLGYYARGKVVSIAVIHHVGSKVAVETLMTFDFEKLSDRIRSMPVFFNISRVLAGLAELCEKEHEPKETLSIKEARLESGGKSVTLKGYTAIKGYLDIKVAQRVWDTYQKIQNCPNAERCRTTAKPLKRKRRDNTEIPLAFTPRICLITRARPTMLKLLEALLHVTEALCYAHGINLMHRDVCWRNVGFDPRTGEWILLDWDEAAQSPSLVPHKLCEQNHAPEMMTGRHTIAVDVWSLGYLMNTATRVLDKSPELVALAEACMHDDPKKRPKIGACKQALLAIQAGFIGASTSKSL